MLKRSFVHIPGIGPAKEKRLWESGILTWQDLRDAAHRLYREQKLADVTHFLDQSEQAYERQDLKFFSDALPRDQQWRLIPECLDSIAYLDIETTGLGFPPLAESTTITFYHQGQVLQEHERTAKERLIRRMRDEAKLLVTFYGQVFDVPFLEREFGFQLGLPHVDLCFWLKRLGHKGGLKSIQKRFEDIPQRDSMDIDGYDAVRLWRMHRSGVPRALETLLTYNAEDTTVLEALLVKAFNMEVERNPLLKTEPMAEVNLPALRTGTCPEVYSRLRQGQRPHDTRRDDHSVSAGDEW